MTYRIELSGAADRDLDTILDFLIESSLSLGKTAEDAVERAAAKLHRTQDVVGSLRAVLGTGR